MRTKRQRETEKGVPPDIEEARLLLREQDKVEAVFNEKKSICSASTQKCKKNWFRLGPLLVEDLQVWAGKVVHVLQCRRCMMVFLEETFATICQPTEGYDMSLKLFQQMLVMEALSPLAWTELRAPCNGGRGATWFAARLPWADRQAGGDPPRRILCEEGAGVGNEGFCSGHR